MSLNQETRAAVCSHCESEERSLTREFSQHAAQALIAWGEIAVQTIHKPICDHCYRELRTVLIDRADELTFQPKPSFFDAMTKPLLA